MNNKDLNELIKNIETDLDILKPIPYVGWVWEEVDFDAPVKIAVIPNSDMHAHVPYIGIVFNNLWNYPEYILTIDETISLKKLIEDCVNMCSYINMEKIQRFLKLTLDCRSDVMDKCQEWRERRASI